MSDRRHSRSSRRYHPLVELTRARVLEFLREPEAVFWVFLFPVLLALTLGIAFRAKPAARLRVAVVGGPGARAAVVATLARADDIDVLALEADEADRRMRAAKVDLIVVCGTDPGTAGVEPVLRFDPTRPESRTARLAVREALQRAAAPAPSVPVREEEVSEPGSRYIDFLVPGLVGLNLMGSGMWGIGFSVVVARTRKLLKRFAVTPMRRGHYLLSFAFSRLLFLFLEVAAIVGFGWLVFGVRVRGSLTALAMVSLLGAMCFAGLGLLVASRPRSIEAVSGWMNLVMLPMWLLSGTFFSYERFPAGTHVAIRALPLTALNDALRSVINEGGPLAASWPELAVMAVWGAGCFAVAVRIFRWQ